MPYVESGEEDDESTLLTIAALVITFFVGLSAWLMAPDYFSSEDPFDVAADTAPLYDDRASALAQTSDPREAQAPQSRPAARPSAEAHVPAGAPAPRPLTHTAVAPVAAANISDALVIDSVPASKPVVAAAPMPEQKPQPAVVPDVEAIPVAPVATSPVAQKSQPIFTAVAKASSTVSFLPSSVVLTDESKAVLDTVAALMNQNPTKRLGIIGHTDSLGDADKNVVLSFARARACAEYLASKGVKSARIDAAGMGEQMPLASNQTSTGRERNRRVEFKLL